MWMGVGCSSFKCFKGQLEVVWSPSSLLLSCELESPRTRLMRHGLTTTPTTTGKPNAHNILAGKVPNALNILAGKVPNALISL